MSVDSKSVKWPMNMQGHFLFRNTFLDPFVILFATNSAIIPEHGVAPLIQKSSWDDLIAFKAIKGWHAHRFEAREHVCVCVCVYVRARVRAWQWRVIEVPGPWVLIRPRMVHAVVVETFVWTWQYKDLHSCTQTRTPLPGLLTAVKRAHFFSSVIWKEAADT